MKLKLIILSVTCLSCLVTPVWSTGLLAAKAAAVIGAAKGAALLGAGALAAKGAFLKGLAAKEAAANKPTFIIQGPLPCTTKPNQHKPIIDIKPGINIPGGILHLKPGHNKPIVEIKPDINVPSIVQVNPGGYDHKPLLELDTNLHSSILRWNSDLAVPALRLPFLRTSLVEVHTPPVTIEESPKVEVKPCPIPLIPVPVPPKYPTVLDKVSGIWNLINGVVQAKTNAVTGLIDYIEPRQKPIVYQIVHPSNSNRVPFEEKIIIGK